MSYANNNKAVYTPKINDVARNYIEELKKEKMLIPDNLPLCKQLIDDAMERIYETGRIPGKPFLADVYKQNPIKLCQKVYLPVKQCPKFNFKGKILGPKGNTLKRLHEETMCNIAIKGRTSLRDQEKEEDMRQSGDPAFNHFNNNLYVEISTVASPAESYARMAYALNEIRKYIIPDKNDEIAQEQYRELLEMNPDAYKTNFIKEISVKSVFDKLGFRGASGSSTGHREKSKSPELPVTYIKARPDQSSFLAKTKYLRPQPYQKTPVYKHVNKRINSNVKTY